ncbi:hypothetical protein DPB67_05740, partial [Salmonella enterica subsp. enterica serovar Singapore]|nr:hypothetical protein [Salmonella enterica subsp. enterica serovar Singapore]
VSRGKRQEHRVRKLEVKQQASPESALAWFSANALNMDSAKLENAYNRAKGVIGNDSTLIQKLDEIYRLRKQDLESV